MRSYKIAIQGTTPMSQSRPVQADRLPRELHDDFEKRTCRGRLHVDDDGVVYVPCGAFGLALSEAAKYLGEQVPGKGKCTWTKHFLAGILVTDGGTLGIKADAVAMEPVFVPSDGVKGSGKRVWKWFPKISTGWTTTFTVQIVDDVITGDVLLRHCAAAGSIIGLGRWRPRNGGQFGRFTVTGFEEMK